MIVCFLLQNGLIIFCIHTHMNHQCGIAAIINDHVRPRAIRPGQGHFGAPPIIFQAFTFPGKNRCKTHIGYGGCRMILGGENIAGGPADVSAKSVQCLDQHCCLDGHVQRTSNFFAGKGLFRTIFAYADRAFPFRTTAFPCGQIPPNQWRQPCKANQDLVPLSYTLLFNNGCWCGFFPHFGTKSSPCRDQE